MARVGGVPRAHSEECRDRIIAEMRRDGALGRRIETAGSRLKRAASHIVTGGNKRARTDDGPVEASAGADTSEMAGSAPAADSAADAPRAAGSSSVAPAETVIEQPDESMSSSIKREREVADEATPM
eukprot:4062291-Amphidinium_carterae.1